mgnify:CR=1 FL=1
MYSLHGRYFVRLGDELWRCYKHADSMQFAENVNLVSMAFASPARAVDAFRERRR